MAHLALQRRWNGPVEPPCRPHYSLFSFSPTLHSTIIYRAAEYCMKYSRPPPSFDEIRSASYFVFFVKTRFRLRILVFFVYPMFVHSTVRTSAKTRILTHFVRTTICYHRNREVGKCVRVELFKKPSLLSCLFLYGGLEVSNCESLI
jgi:hypothetical protein